MSRHPMSQSPKSNMRKCQLELRQSSASILSKVAPVLSSVMENIVNFNHLLSKIELRAASRVCTCGSAYWLPTSEGRATAADNIALQLYCKHCDARTHIFMSTGEYQKHSKVIIKEVSGE